MKLSEIRARAEWVLQHHQDCTAPAVCDLGPRNRLLLGLVDAVEEMLIALDWKQGEYGPKGGFTWDTFIGHLQGVRCEVLAKLEAL